MTQTHSPSSSLRPSGQSEKTTRLTFQREVCVYLYNFIPPPILPLCLLISASSFHSGWLPVIETGGEWRVLWYQRLWWNFKGILSSIVLNTRQYCYSILIKISSKCMRPSVAKLYFVDESYDSLHYSAYTHKSSTSQRLVKDMLKFLSLILQFCDLEDILVTMSGKLTALLLCSHKHLYTNGKLLHCKAASP